MLTLYARREPTEDTFLGRQIPDKKDVQIYKDRAGRKPYARFMWFQRGIPKPRDRKIILDCYMWDLVWIPERKKRGNNVMQQHHPRASHRRNHGKLGE